MDLIKVLLVDDERDFVDLLAKRLRTRDLVVECAYDGEKAVEVLFSEGALFDIVVLDMKMPGMDGIEVLKKIKENRPDLEVIMLTGHATLDTAVEGLKFDAFDYLVKPIDIETLMRKIKDAYNKRYHNGGHDLRTPLDS